jgi:hypothetical protein
MVRLRYSVGRACLKKWCFKSFSELGRFFGSLTKQVATNSLKDWEGRTIYNKITFLSNRCYKVFREHHKPLKISCLFHNQDLEEHSAMS